MKNVTILETYTNRFGEVMTFGQTKGGRLVIKHSDISDVFEPIIIFLSKYILDPQEIFAINRFINTKMEEFYA